MSSSSGFENFQRVGFRDLVGAQLGLRREQVAAAIGAAVFMTERHVTGFIGRNRERETAQLGGHRVEAGGFGIDRDDAEVVSARDPFLQARQRAHAFVFGAVDLGVAGSFGAGGGERDRGEGAGLGGRACCGRRLFLFRRRRRAEIELAALLPSAGDAPAGRQLLVRLDLAGIDAALLGDAAGDGGEFHRLQKRDEVLVVRLVHGQLVDRHVERHVLVERDQPLGDARDLGIVDQGLAALVLFDLAGARQQRFEVAIFADQLRRGLDADAGHARHVVG